MAVPEAEMHHRFSWMEWIVGAMGRSEPSVYGVSRAQVCNSCGVLFEPRPPKCPDVMDEKACRNCNGELRNLKPG